jgi:pimeloyl-ACP methyl ester carboxylesterase
MFKRFTLVFCLLGLLLAACQQQKAVPTPDLSSGNGQPVYVDTWSDDFKGEIEWVDCTFDAYQAEPQCGYLTVPEDYSQPNNGETLRLALAVYKTRNTDPKPDPLILVISYPLTNQSGFLPYIFEEVYKEHDLVIMDMRGTGMSEPALPCPTLNNAFWDALPMGGLTPDAWGKQHEQCRQTLESQQVNLDLYSINNIANDLKALRLALGYAKWNLITVEPTGAYLAYEQLRIDPEGVRSLVFDSVAPNYSDQPADFSAAPKVLSEMFTLCAQDEKCNGMFPDLEKVFYEVVDQLNNQSIKVVAYDTTGGRRTEVQVDGNYLVDMILNGMMNADLEIIGHYPRMIYQIHEGNTEVLARFAGNQLSGSDYSYEALNSLLFCRQMPYPDENMVNVATSSLPSGLASYFNNVTKANRAICDAWSPVATVVPPEPSASFAPVLLLNGGWNWAWGAEGDVERFKKSAPEAQVVTIPMAGRNNFFTRSVMTCTQQMFNAFITDPEKQVDSSCVPTEREITWITMR